MENARKVKNSQQHEQKQHDREDGHRPTSAAIRVKMLFYDSIGHFFVPPYVNNCRLQSSNNGASYNTHSLRPGLTQTRSVGWIECTERKRLRRLAFRVQRSALGVLR